MDQGVFGELGFQTHTDGGVNAAIYTSKIE